MEGFSTEQIAAIQAIREGKSIFLTGPGGTGKSHLIKSLHDLFPEKQISLTALTGCAALLIGCGAKTLHSWAGIGLGKGTVSYHALNIRKIPPLAKRWRSTNILVIDEVSMLTPELLELLDGIARELRKTNRPMGGMQVVFVGDFLQLPPVSKGQETRFAFESPVWHKLIQETIHLKRIFRQADTKFQQILDEARMGGLKQESYAALMARKDLDWSNELIKPTILFTRKADVEAINQSHLVQRRFLLMVKRLRKFAKRWNAWIKNQAMFQNCI
jgi:ATP-dependent DNA helicase PIF1